MKLTNAVAGALTLASVSAAITSLTATDKERVTYTLQSGECIAAKLKV